MTAMRVMPAARMGRDLRPRGRAHWMAPVRVRLALAVVIDDLVMAVEAFVWMLLTAERGRELRPRRRAHWMAVALGVPTARVHNGMVLSRAGREGMATVRRRPAAHALVTDMGGGHG